MSRSSVKGTGWEIIKIILAIITFGLFIYQIFFAGQWITNNQHEGRKISSADYESLVTGEMVWGRLENIVAECGSGEDSKGTLLKYYLAKTDGGKLLILRTQDRSKCDITITKILSGSEEEAYFIGYVKSLLPKDGSVISLTMLADNTLDKLNIDGELSDAVLNQVVDVSIYEKYIDEKVFIASIVGGLFMLLLTFLLLRKTIKNIVYSINVAHGKIQPYMPEIDYVQHKDEFKKYEEINPDNADDIEYYDNYEKDSVDFTQEKERRTIYGEEYQKPTLEKDIETYESYKYDSMDFAQDEVDEKDINQF